MADNTALVLTIFIWVAAYCFLQWIRTRGPKG